MDNPLRNKMRQNRTWKTLNISWDTYDNMRTMRKTGESMNNLVRRIMGLPVPDPTRERSRRTIYYDEDYKSSPKPRKSKYE